MTNYWWDTILESHIDQIASKLCSTCYVLQNLKHILPKSTLRIIYYAYIHSTLSYDLIFWGRSSSTSKLFILQNKIVRIITKSGLRESCSEAFKNVQFMTFYSQYIFLLILFTVKNIYLPLIMNFINSRLGTILTCIYQLLTCLILQRTIYIGHKGL